MLQLNKQRITDKTNFFILANINRFLGPCQTLTFMLNLPADKSVSLGQQSIPYPKEDAEPMDIKSLGNPKHKTVIAFKSLEDVTPAGLTRAEMLGAECRAITHIERIFVGPIPNSRVTAEAFVRGYGWPIPVVDPPLDGLGTGKLMDEMIDDEGEFVAAITKGMSVYAAFREAWGDDVDYFYDFVYEAHETMWEQTADGEVSIYFGHSPWIELYAEGSLNLEPGVKYDKVPELVGVVLELQAGEREEVRTRGTI